MEFMTSFMVPVIIGICLCVGYIVKHWIKDVDNKFIPTLCAVLGVIISIWINWSNITPDVILQGLASGLASTGLHQAFSQFIGSKK
jgi:Na+/glutamate symporter